MDDIKDISCFKEEFFDGKIYSSIFLHTHSLRHMLEGITAAEFDVAVRLAVEAVRTTQTSAKSLQYKDALTSEIHKVVEQHKKELDEKEAKGEVERQRLQQQYMIQQQKLETEIRNLQTTLGVSDVTISKLREQVGASEAMFRTSLEDIEQKKDLQFSRELERLQMQYQQTLEMVKTDAKEQVERLRCLYSEQEEKIRKQFEKALVSSEKGKVGEREFDELAAQYTNWGPLQNTSKSSHSTDRAGVIRGHPVLFELKNYTSDVPSHEVDKFERDMEEHHNTPFGVFISLKSWIRNKRSDGFLTIKWTPRSQLLLFINQFYQHNVEDVFKFIETCADIAWNVYKAALEQPVQGDALYLQGRIDSAKLFVEKEVSRFEGMLLTMAHDKQFLMNTLQKQHDNYVYNLKQSLEALKMILDLLLNGSSSSSSSNVVMVESAIGENSSSPSLKSTTEVVKKGGRGKSKKNTIVVADI